MFWKFKSIIRSWLFIYIDLDNPVYIDFAYTSDPRIFEVLIYRVDIEPHSSSPTMFWWWFETSSAFMFEWRRCDFLYISIRLVWEPKLVRTHCCELASKTWFFVYVSKLWIWNSNSLIDWCLCCLFNCLIILNHYA